jgi:hypothetical protein
MTKQNVIDYTFGEQLGALVFIVFIAAVGGIAIDILGGLKVPPIGKRFKGFEIKPIIKKVTLPPILGMIVMGCIGRNYFGDLTKPFPNVWA